jgi:hypothetical protein
MRTKHWRLVSWPALTFVLASPLLMNCGALGKLAGGNCPDMANVDAVAKFDWAKNFKLKADVGAKIKGGVTAAVNLQALHAQIDGDLKVACGGIAKDLGAEVPADADGKTSCELAVKAMGDVKAKIGASASLKLDVQPPKCSASIGVMADCAASCDVNVKPGSAKVECEGGEISGKCDAECKGSCELTAAAECKGTCSGKCSAEMSGKCTGTCDGKCDGKDAKGECAGKCEGKCDGNVEGECKANCEGSCKASAGGKCEGTCSGGCSVEMKAPKCSGELKPPEMSADCKASCDAKVSGNLECTPARVTIKIDGATDTAAAAMYKAAIEKNLPLVLKVAIGMKDRAAAAAASVKGVVEGTQAVATSVKGPAAISLVACVGAPIKGAITAAAGIKGNIDVSVNVNASASASGGGSAGTK